MTVDHVALISGKLITLQNTAGLNRRCQLTALLTGFLFLLPLSGVGFAGDARQAFFAEPTSGRKVTDYEIELPVTPDERQTFNIPGECAKVMLAINKGMNFKGNIVDRRLWKKTENDCRYHGFLNRHPQQVVEDHVSGYDFRNAKISDLPLDPRCAKTGTAAIGCNPGAADEFGMLRFFPISSPVGTIPEMANCTSCEFTNGRFRGYVVLDGEDIRCGIDANAPGLRLIAVNFSDINGDRILDAVLRLIPIGPGGNRVPLILPLTRLDTTSAFSVPDTTLLQPE